MRENQSVLRPAGGKPALLLMLWLSTAAADDCRYLYDGVITDVYDGDTVTADISLGLGSWMIGQKIRLLNVNTPEIRGVADKTPGLKARDYLRDRVLGKRVVIRTDRDEPDKYGRLLATIFVDGKDVNYELLSEGLAEMMEY